MTRDHTDGSGHVRLSDHERALARLMRGAHLAGDHDLPRLFEEYAASIGVTPIRLYLVDLQQRVLVPFLGPAGPGKDENPETLSVDATLAGRGYQRVEILTQPLDRGRVRVWVPLLDGTERLGMLAATLPGAEDLDAHDGAMRTRLMTFAALAAELVMTKTLYGDTVVRLRRTAPMGLAAETQWSMLPPLTFSNGQVTISGGLEPAYEVGGDTVDYAVDARTAHLAIFDGMGHGLRSSQLAAMAVASYRNARRTGQDLTRTVRLVDEAISLSFGGEAFLTGLLAELDCESGRFTWISAGHPAPLLLRDGGVLKELHVEPSLPLGLSGLLDERPSIGTESLEPGDMVLLYSDGVVDARSPTGQFFGIDRLVGLVTRHLGAGLPAPETMRRVITSLLDHQQGQLDDDASLLLVQFRPDGTALLP
ncbi:MAG: Serine phosphatase RsbU, regulator of sigma subunit [uncultured Nocardioides sp.]|uniref:Serine phosphatase RsbU, regulator of sigma subunit n=1 Tax=uncultured Nocardioides sp. TaxID=198441 RepID=A0A6J4MZS2_9ACTN|nr:MAG: Serine phosphatase RsbU, regulator of sigma subunit [uncultured Nocardioides sp.]